MGKVADFKRINFRAIFESFLENSYILTNKVDLM